MRKVNNLAIFIFVIFVSIININKILAVEFQSIGDSNVGAFDSCGAWNGCVGRIGYRFTIISSSYTVRENSVEYTIKSGSRAYEIEDNRSPSEIKDAIISADEILGQILYNTISFLSVDSFINGNYAIMIEPVFKAYYWDDNPSYCGNKGSNYYKISNNNHKTIKGTAATVASEIINIKNSKGDCFLDGFWSVNQLFPCTAYIPYAGSSNDSFCQETADGNHRLNYLNLAKENSRFGKWIIKASDVRNPYGTLKIQKVNKFGDIIWSDRTTFKLYGSGGCNESSYIRDLTFTGTTSISLEAGDYYIKEVTPPKGYIITLTNGLCTHYSVQSGKTTTASITNTATCESEFEALNDKTSPIERIKLYKRYGKRGLLDFTKTTASDACSSSSCSNNFSVDVGCLSARTNTSFGPTNLSCYSEEIRDPSGNMVGFCGYSYELTNYLNSNLDNEYTEEYNFGSNFKSGQMVLKRNWRKIAVGTLRRKCYVYGYDISDIPDDVENRLKNYNYDDYIGEVTLNGRELNLGTKSSASSKTHEGEGKYRCVSLSTTIFQFYDLWPVYSKLGTGEISNENCTNCKNLGYGFASKLTTVSSDMQKVDFSLVLYSKLHPSLPARENKYESDTCTYSIKNEIIDKPGDPNGNLNLEFRIIDTNDPFPGKSGNGRQVGENWCAIIDERFDANKDGKINAVDSNLIKSSVDINKDGKLNYIDETLADKIVKKIAMGKYGNPIVQAVKDCNSNNIYIESIMEITNNSYDKNNAGPIYTIELNSATINSIRTYNKTHSYDDYNMECDSNGENCKSLFLEEFEISRNQ